MEIFATVWQPSSTVTLNFAFAFSVKSTALSSVIAVRNFWEKYKKIREIFRLKFPTHELNCGYGGPASKNSFTEKLLRKFSMFPS